jgi:hypothetical protein
MSAEVYQFDIARADRAGDLHALRQDILADETLATEEKAALLENIRLKFGARNLRASGQQKPRWN